MIDLRRRDVEPVAERRVDPELHAVAQPVVDHRRDQGALGRHGGLTFDHRRDLEHVVGRQVLRAGIGEVDRPPAPAEGLDLVAARAASRSCRRGSRRSRGRGSPRGSSAACAPKHGTTARAEAARYADSLSRTRPCRSCSAIFATTFTRAAICDAREALGEDDPERLRRAVAAAAERPSCGGAPPRTTPLRPQRAPRGRGRRRRCAGAGPEGSAALSAHMHCAFTDTSRLTASRRAIPGSSRAGRRPHEHRRRRRETR